MQTQLISSLMAQVVMLAYVGSKPIKNDTITDTKIAWHGFGDIQPVPADKASVLLRHPDVWVTEAAFKAGLQSGKYKPRQFANLNVDPNADDIVLGGDCEDGDAEDDGEGESQTEGGQVDGDPSIIQKIQEHILSIDTDKKPAIDSIRAALPGLTISVKDLNQAWKELSGE